ncbi:hypothetical protein FF1_032480 [Malus domestica]
MSKDSKGREDCSAVTTTESRPSKVRSQNKHHHLRPRTLASVPEDDLILKSRHWLNSGSKEHVERSMHQFQCLSVMNLMSHMSSISNL